MKPLRIFFSALFMLLLLQELPAQVAPTTEPVLKSSIEARAKLRAESIFSDYPSRSIGPVVMSGRITDIAVHPENARIFYIGIGSGGIFKTINNGTTFEPVFDHQAALGIGDLAISPANPNVIWAGTGENNASRSTYAGAGVFKSMDGGTTWEHAGLLHSQHIGRIVAHPANVNTAWVASVGSLYSENNERGLYKTTDGGKTWKRTLFVNDSTGVIDVAIHPSNPNILWASTWEKDRKAWNFKEGGVGSAIYKSTDGGETWKKSVKGFPQGDFVGRIGLDVSISNPNIVYAVVDNQFETRTERTSNNNQPTLASVSALSVDEFLKIENRSLNQILRSNQFPQEYTPERVKTDIKNGKYTPKALQEYVGDANQALFNTSIKGAEVYKSTNGGDSWTKVNSYDLDGVFNTFGYYFGQIRVDPNDPNTVYIFGVPFLKSTDGGKTWSAKAENQSVHVDHHALWINPKDSEHILLGNDGGIYQSQDGGENFIHHNSIPIAQFYSVNVDMETPYNVYGGMQDNGTFVGSSRSVPNRSPSWQRLFGGDGMHVAPDPRNPDIVYVGFQFGNYNRLDRGKGESKRITPRHQVGEDRYRYNWNTPVVLSPHNPDIIYFGSQRLNRSLDRGDTWEAISPDLTHNLPNGDVPYSTITTIAESKLKFGTIWVGTDDGRVHVTRDGGASWNDVSAGLPARRWISKVHPSVHEEGTAYVSLNGYRFDEFSTHLYKTTDFGKTWKSVKGNLPEEVANVIFQDPVNPNILYAGLDHGTYVSLDDGAEWHYLSNIPNVASYDLLVHPRDHELVVGTHGRSIWVMDVKPLHKVANSMSNPVIGLDAPSIRFSPRWGAQGAQYRNRFMPEVELLYYLGGNGNRQSVTIEVLDKDNNKVTEIKTTGKKGFNTYSWDLVTEAARGNNAPKFLQRGDYTLKFKVGNSSSDVSFKIQ